MADDITLNTGSGGAVIATDDDGSRHFQYVKLAFGADNTQTLVGSISSNSLPVALSDVDNAVLDTIDAVLDLINAKLVTGTVIGDVNVVGSALTALQLLDNIVVAEDAAHGDGDSGVMALAVRNDTLAALAGADGDYAPFQVNASGALFIQEGSALDVSGATLTVNAHAVTNAGTFVVQEDGAALTALQLIDNIVQAEDAVHSSGASGVMALAVRNDTLAALAGADGDYTPFQVNASGALFIQEGAAMDVSAATLTINAHAVTNAGTFVVQEDGAALTSLQLIDNIVQAEDAVHGNGDSGVMALAVRNDALAALAGTDGDYAPFQVNASGALFIQEGAALDVSGATLTVNAHAVTNAGTFVVQEDGAALTSLQLLDNVVYSEDVALQAADPGVSVMAVRDDELTAGGGAADNDYMPLRSDHFGRLRTTDMGDATSVVKYGVINVASSGNNTIQAAAGAGIKIKVLALMVMAGGTVTVRVESGADGTALTGEQELTAQTGFVLPYNPEGWFETADNVLLNLELSGAVNVDGVFTYVED